MNSKSHLLCALFLSMSLLATAGSVHSASQANPVPIPPGEQALPSETAQSWITVSPENNILEGAIFDADGNLLFCDVSRRRIMRLTPEKELTTLLELPDMGVGGIAFHPDGRLFMAALDLAKGKGAILAWSPEKGKIDTIIPPEAGYWPNDLVFERGGGFYFSNFRRNTAQPAGGIYYAYPDGRQIIPVIPNLDQANGVALSPDGKTLWATEFAKNRLHRAVLTDPVNLSPIGAAIPYHFTGITPDSMRVDRNGNVYVALYGQGRVLVFNERGIPVQQILLPERELGKNLLSTSLALNPKNNEMFIVSSNEQADQPAKIFRANALAEGLPPLSAGAVKIGDSRKLRNWESGLAKISALRRRNAL